MSRKLLWSQPSPAGPWQLGAFDLNSTVLIGWRSSAEDDGRSPPAPVAAALSASLTSLWRVTFLSGSAVGSPRTWTRAAGDEWNCSVDASATSSWLPRLLRPREQILALKSTRTATEVAKMFEDADYPWWYQSQFALLSSDSAPPPCPEGEAFRKLLDDEWQQQAAAFVEGKTACGALRPGVDGDLAALYVPDPQQLQRFKAALRAHCEAASLELHEVQPERFAAELADSY